MERPDQSQTGLSPPGAGRSSPIYLDHHATTPVDPRALEAMLPYFCEHFGNAASRSHAFGWAAEKGVSLARQQVADLIGCQAKELVITSGATESNNLAIKGVAAMYGRQGRHIVTTRIEHKSVLDPCKRLEKEGFEVTYVGVDRQGRVDPALILEAIRNDTILISVMAANNEVGTIQPMAEIGALAKVRKILFHCDATQAVGKIHVDVQTWGVDLMSLSAHKMYGPKGVGALYVRSRDPRVRLVPILDGGGHERGLRSGTLNVPGIVGFGSACAIARSDLDADQTRIRAMSERLYHGLTSRLSHVSLNGPPEDRLAGNLNVVFAGVEGDALMMSIPEIAVSSGSACTSATLEPFEGRHPHTRIDRLPVLDRAGRATVSQVERDDVHLGRL